MISCTNHLTPASSSYPLFRLLYTYLTFIDSFFSTKLKYIELDLHKLQHFSCSADDDIQSVDEDSAPLCSDSIGPLVQRNARLSTGNVGNRQDAALPPMHDLDVSVIESLPPELLSEINNMYNGKLLRFISEKKNNSADICPNNFEGIL